MKFKSTTDIGVALTHIIHSGWVKNLLTSSLTFDIAQFFPFLNHRILTLILRKVGLDNQVINFFANYLVGRKTNYFWNNFTSPLFDVNVGVGQESALSLILSALYLLLFLYILEKCLKHLKIPVFFISFIDNGLFNSQSNTLHISNCCLFCSYNVMTNLLDKFSFVVKYSKTEVFHFSRPYGPFNTPSLNLLPLSNLILTPKNSWKYLGFIFNRKLTFHQHINFYSNSVLSLVKCMKLLGNSSHSITPL